MSDSRVKNGRRFFVPEVVQTSAMDCGPASLKAILEGFGISVSYGRLREACQTSVDGTSIDTLEDVALQLGLDAEQIMVPVDHVLLEEAHTLPALAVVRLPSGLTHFIVVWRTVGDWVQVMNPGVGRQWMRRKRFLDALFVHQMPVPAQAWREWVDSEDFLSPLRQRLRALLVPEVQVGELIEMAQADSTWRGFATLDAATRLVTSLVKSGGLESGEQASKVLLHCFTSNCDAHKASLTQDSVASHTRDVFPIPDVYWSVESFPVDDDETAAQDEYFVLRGAVLVRIKGLRDPSIALLEPDDDQAKSVNVLSPELVAALEEAPARPAKEIWRALRADGLFAPLLLCIALGLAAFGLTIQTMLLQGLMRIGQRLPLLEQRWGAVGTFFIFLMGLFLTEIPLMAVALRIGRRLEARLRIAFFEKLPRLNDRYFHSRLISDMTERAHSLRGLRNLPILGVNLLRLGFQLLLTTAGVIWLQPTYSVVPLLATLVFIGLAFMTSPLLEERDMRVRSHFGALSRFYLDALLGLIPLRAHRAERAFRREHESLLVEWVRASEDFSRLAVVLQGFSALLYSSFAIWIVLDFLVKNGEITSVLLLFYWTLNLPALGQAFVQSVQQYPTIRNRTLRLLEPLGAPDDVADAPPDSEEADGVGDAFSQSSSGGVRVDMRDVRVEIAGHTILSEIDFSLHPGEHVAVVGPSGAGKSTLVGILLGWHTPADGMCWVDGAVLGGKHLLALRRVTAWVDPAVQLWNRSLLKNLTYGNAMTDVSANGLSIEQADLFDVLERLESGLQTVLGEGGGLVSGGEGQRVRLGRAFNRSQVRLVILDEPFRGIDRARRQQLLNAARQHWQNATLICVTHDVGETQDFDRVVVLEGGMIVEDGAPAVLREKPESYYHRMLEAEDAVRQGLWASAEWRHLWMEDGNLSER